MMQVKFILFLGCCLLAIIPARSDAQTSQAPKLVLQITVDQLRGDLPLRFHERLSDGGFKYLLKHGTVFRNAHHRHANTETIVGHTTLATGADPSIHGMVGNVWLDRSNGQLKYNVEDAALPDSDKGGRRRSENRN